MRSIWRNQTGIEDWILEKAYYRRKDTDQIFHHPYDMVRFFFAIIVYIYREKSCLLWCSVSSIDKEKRVEYVKNGHSQFSLIWLEIDRIGCAI